MPLPLVLSPSSAPRLAASLLTEHLSGPSRGDSHGEFGYLASWGERYASSAPGMWVRKGGDSTWGRAEGGYSSWV